MLRLTKLVNPSQPLSQYSMGN